MTQSQPVEAKLALEVESEQRYLDALYARLDTVKAEARSELDRVRLGPQGGTHQSRSERDAMARIYEDRIAQLREVDDRLAFGRLESDGGDYRYIGRIGLRDADLQPLLLDWRVPQASAFYQATAATPLGVRARRHLSTDGRRITRIEDELLGDLGDPDRPLSGESALMAALTAQRTGRMHDIVATIQAEQDRIIRSDLRGVLVVQGGPGTGKTAVALHRAAYLLYTHRDRLASSGLLVVGPSRSFLRYIEQVLPSLGETGVVLSSLGSLYPGIDAQADDPADVAALKGSPRMTELLRRAVHSRQVVPTETQTVEVNGESIDVSPELIAKAIRRAQDSRKPHNEARVTFVSHALAALTSELSARLRRRGDTIDDEDVRMLREDVRSSQDVRVLLNTAWLPLTPEKLLGDLYARPQWLASLTPSWNEQKRSLLHRDRGAAWTISDIPLLDEAAELLGEAPAANAAAEAAQRRQRALDIENAENAIRNMGVEGLVSAEALADGFAESGPRLTAAERASTDRSWTFGHIVVDEAQELSPMQWRLLRRRAPLRSFTIVGDIAQASSPVAASNWSDAIRSLGAEFRLEELTVNYRTPTQIAALAERTAKELGLNVTSSQSVRESEWEPRELTVTERALVPSLVEAVRADRMLPDPGTLAVIAPEALVGELHAALHDEFGASIGLGSASLSQSVSVMSPRTAKGLEFDSVVAVDPDGIVAAEPRGVSALYVTLTRATQRLTVLKVS
ncbi:UvrD-helicase domain-containing protein [Herbiconiux sp. L3-i23]|uniref:HelD family protein n=1 Tax=Herbiconiux sp. L3-i23 TaxID=2905871 RepID=UPI0020581A13|nr:UvrD-helicase domain-containing protein [Herbiconiux sp. L3-i23]BDI22138.1 DNA helicase [Herbiconiux sp. L3-i23]